MTYEEKLNQTKNSYPFHLCRGRFDGGLEQYTQENCDKARKIFDDLIADLAAKGETAAASLGIMLKVEQKKSKTEDLFLPEHDSKKSNK